MTVLRAEWIAFDQTQAVCRALTDAGAQALFVGGCVRDALLGVNVSDIDIATDAIPEDTIELAVAAGLKAIPTGIDHGTITVLSGGRPYEITTFRKDIETDGRKATVRFSKDLKDDARRRDFTMNALYATPQGKVVDPLGGMDDLRARRVRFIEDPAQRIEEDYLRILRFFRFSAWYAEPENGFDLDALAAIAGHLDGLDRLSKERIGKEMLKLLSAPDPAPAIATMNQMGILDRILSGAQDRALAPLIHIENSARQQPDALRRLAALSAATPADDLRLSKSDARAIMLLRESAASTASATELGYRLGEQQAIDAILLRNALFETEFDESTLLSAKVGSQQVFPVKAADLMPEYTGKALGKKLETLQSAWIRSGFTLTRDALLSGSY
ncbi:CCA tRNA nucleotidyltransferase [Sulfitobacter sp. JL08]|uniref:CCA tRNA nucleotidyltransferase n=1 Tax=Sulfitobacter sp. JL08 TaxID=2070369 RepID=UPI000E0B9AB0|nr:CCA tRNA nucleotidyltransferase [Sulfitobacter sp. JL08]AXI56575.1 CCA tRNA nucleotidyltransferase [Sulfitobacter sp. JL08]